MQFPAITSSSAPCPRSSASVTSSASVLSAAVRSRVLAGQAHAATSGWSSATSPARSFSGSSCRATCPSLVAGETRTGFEWAGPGEPAGESKPFLPVVVLVAEACEVLVDDADLASRRGNARLLP